MPTRANRDTNSYGMKVGNGAQAPHTEIEDRICLNITRELLRLRLRLIPAAENLNQLSVPSLRLSREFCDMNCLGGIEKSNR